MRSNISSDVYVHPQIGTIRKPAVFSIPTVVSESRSFFRKFRRGRCQNNVIPVKLTERNFSPVSFIEFTYINIGSMKNKTTSIYDYICENKVDVFVIAETWLFSNEEENATYINSFLPTGFSFKHCPRPQPNSHTAGGVGLIYRNSISVEIKSSSNNPKNKIEQFEFFDCVLNQRKDARSSIRIIILYRPPPSPVNKLKLKLFWKEWSKFLSLYSGSSAEVVFVGDLNLHLEESNLASTKRFTSIIKEHSLIQHIKAPTHTAGHTLDVLITKTESKILQDSIKIHDPGFSDNLGTCTTTHHYAIDFSFCYEKPQPLRKSIKYRNVKNVDFPAVTSALNDLSLVSKLSQCKTVDEMVSIYSVNLKTILDMHAPEKTRTVIERPNSSWFTPELQQMKIIKRKLERRWKKSKTKFDHITYRKYCSRFSGMLNKSRVKKSLDEIEACGNDRGRLFKFCNTLIGHKKQSQILLANCKNETETAQSFADFFDCKVQTICKELDDKAKHSSCTESSFPLPSSS